MAVAAGLKGPAEGEIGARKVYIRQFPVQGSRAYEEVHGIPGISLTTITTSAMNDTSEVLKIPNPRVSHHSLRRWILAERISYVSLLHLQRQSIWRHGILIHMHILDKTKHGGGTTFRACEKHGLHLLVPIYLCMPLDSHLLNERDFKISPGLGATWQTSY